MKVGDRGRVTIPKDLRDHLDIRIGDEVIFHPSEDGNRLILEKKRDNGDREERRLANGV